jgi:molybdenum cofactor cytidylyltransferase
MLGILLAAGASSRFGADKLRHALPHGVTIAVQAARHLRAAMPRVLAVVRPGQEDLGAALRAEGCEVVVCERASEGMGASLAWAVRSGGSEEGYVVALADMPFIRSSTIAAVRDAIAEGASLAAPYFHTKRGHPVGISGRHAPLLQELTGDEGARSVLAAHAAELVKIPVGDPGVLRDIDRPEDLARPPRA